jgi:hypothetical protein
MLPVCSFAPSPSASGWIDQLGVTMPILSLVGWGTERLSTLSMVSQLVSSGAWIWILVDQFMSPTTAHTRLCTLGLAWSEFSEHSAYSPTECTRTCMTVTLCCLTGQAWELIQPGVYPWRGQEDRLTLSSQSGRQSKFCSQLCFGSCMFPRGSWGCQPQVALLGGGRTFRNGVSWKEFRSLGTSQGATGTLAPSLSLLVS